MYSLLDNRVRDLPALILGKAVVQPIIADRSSEGCLGRDEKFVTCPIRKSANGQKLGFGTIAISRIACEEPHEPERLYSETKQTCDIEWSSRAVR